MAFHIKCVIFGLLLIATNCSSESALAKENSDAELETSSEKGEVDAVGQAPIASSNKIDKAATATNPSLDTPSSIPVTATRLNLPSASLKEIGRIEGDLNNDGTSELILIVEELNVADEYNRPRSILIYKKDNDLWELSETLTTGVLGSDEGGTMGDPYQEIGIERGTIVINHFGGSRQKWKYTHRYRYQNKRWELIGATILFGAPCDYWKTYDYNLSTGTVEAEEIIDDCETEEETRTEYTFQHRISPLPYLGDFRPGETKVDLPDKRGEFYF